ncbi:MAG: Acetyl-CoA acetyltransferase [Syntrophorhabdaceae bacterium PtaU1.Bin034]|nr:MAG: Acetyl-CoA acetyltransferase [Syntrophorhabdaceae bacterium PtaU1.Bin034]
MKEIVIVGATRTPIGEFGGSLRDVSAVSLAVTAIESVVKRAGIEKDMIGQVILGNSFEPLDMNVARIATVKAGFPIETPAFHISATCGSGMQAIMCGIQAIGDGDVDFVIAGGTESMSSAPYILTSARWGQRLQHAPVVDMLWRGMQEYPIGDGMGMTAENLAEKYSISREEQDSFALRSQQLASRAVKEGRFREEITPVRVPRRKGDPKVFDTDEYPKADTSLEKLARLPAVFKKGGSVTAGNACGMNDAAAVVVLTSKEKAQQLGLKPLAKIISYAVVGVEPSYMGIGPVPATKRALKKSGLSLNDIQLVEINEAFAAQYLACERELGWNRDIVNVNGSGISLGHPVGATGCRLVVSLIHEMEKRDVTLGLATLCAGGGQGFATIVERM